MITEGAVCLGCYSVLLVYKKYGIQIPPVAGFFSPSWMEMEPEPHGMELPL